MESLVASSSWNAMSSVDDPKLRMPSRPPPRPSSKPINSRRTGMAAEDLGSSFAKTSKQIKYKSSLKEKKVKVARTSDSDSTDELDTLPPSSRANSRAGSVDVEDERDRKDGYTDEKGVHHKFHPSFLNKSNVLKGLKFKKNKPDDGQAADASSSQPSVVKEHGNVEPSETRKPAPLPQPPQTSTCREHSPRRTTRKRSPSPDRRPDQSTAPTRVNLPSKSTRPKPRPLERKASPGHLAPKAFPVVVSPPPRSPARRMTISGTPSRTVSDRSPLRVSDNDDPRIRAPFRKLKAEAFPSLSPRVTSKFPSLDPLGSQEQVTVKKSVGKRTVSEKIVTTKSLPPAVIKGKESARTKIRKRPANSASLRRTIMSSDDSDGDEGPEQDDAPSAQPFPMSLQGLNSIGSLPPSDAQKNNTPKAQPFPMSILDSVESLPPPSGEAPRKKKSRAQPFPMSTQVLTSIVSSPSIAPSSLKRSSSENYDEPDSKRLKEDEPEEQDVQEIDPKTLCPYCDMPLPSQPTSQLRNLLASAAKKSRSEPRPGNPLGRTAPFTVYIAICQRHRFESQILPEAERKGWPKTIDWSELGNRVRKMKGALRAIIEDNGKADSDLSGGLDESQPRARCVFWREALEEVRLKGTRAVAGVRGQFASFEKMQPGYYGEMGSVIIHQTLYDLFPPASIDSDLVSPLTASEFLQRIMVPEIGARLIMQDMDFDESQIGDAVKILRESANYGVAMFPVDEGEEEEVGPDDFELGAADMIVMKRAMKRRKELDADERAEEEEYRRQMENAKEAEKRETVKKTRKKKKAGELDIEAESPPQVLKPRPKPRPLGKSTSTTSVSDVEMATSVGDTDVEDVPKSSQDGPKPRRLLSRSGTFNEGDRDVEDTQHSENLRMKPRRLSPVTSCIPKDAETPISRPKPRRLPSRSMIDPQHTDMDATPRNAVALTRKLSYVDINLCSSSESSTDNDCNNWDTGRMKRGQNQKKHRGKSKIPSDGDDDAMHVPSSSSSKTPLSTRSRKRTLSDSDDDTPKPSKTLTNEMNDFWDIPPLQRARERNQKSTASSRQKESHAWLLSDNSHSSMESNEY